MVKFSYACRCTAKWLFSLLKHQSIPTPIVRSNDYLAYVQMNPEGFSKKERTPKVGISHFQCRDDGSNNMTYINFCKIKNNVQSS